MIQKLKKGLHKIDIFGQQITLNMNQEAFYTTEFGGFSSLLIITCVILFFFSNIIDFFGKTSVTTNSETILSNDPNQLTLNKNNYMMALSIEQSNFSTNPFFNISAEFRTYQRSDDGQLKKTIELIKFQPCQFEQFNTLFSKYGVNFTSQYQELNLETWICPEDNFTINLSGTYSSQQFDFIKIIVSDCNNITDENQLWKPICADDQTRENWLENEGQFKLQFYQINAIINPSKNEDYLQYYFDSDMYFTFVPKKLSRQANIYLRETEINTDNSLMPYQNIDTQKVIIRKNEDYRDLTELGRDTDDQYAIIYLRRSPFTEYIQRSYQKIGELLSYLGGVVQIMRLFFGLFISYYNRQQMLIELSNKLYDFREKNEKPRSRSFIGSNRSKFNDEQIHSPDPDVMNDVKNDLRIQTGMLLGNFRDQIEKLLQTSIPLKITLKLFLNKITCGYFFVDKNSIFLKKAVTKMNQDLDLHSILYKLDEIGKLKKLLLNEQQLVLFNFSPKQQIYLHGNQKIPSRLLIQEQNQINIKPTIVRQNNLNIDNKSKIADMLTEALKSCSDDITNEESKLCLYKINSKLIEMIDQESKNNITSQQRLLTQIPKKTFTSFKYQITNQQIEHFKGDEDIEIENNHQELYNIQDQQQNQQFEENINTQRYQNIQLQQE